MINFTVFSDSLAVSLLQNESLLQGKTGLLHRNINGNTINFTNSYHADDCSYITQPPPIFFILLTLWISVLSRMEIIVNLDHLV